ncbi:MAG: NAD+ synthase [Phycisphaerae bacterium]
MRIALAQINPLIGDLEGNGRKIASFVDRAADAGAELVVFPELAIIGYPPKDLLLKDRFVDDNIRAVEALAQRLKHAPATLVGFVDHNPAPVGRFLRNAMALLRGGNVAARFYKSLLPTYDVFDEHRYFEPGDTKGLAQVRLGGAPCPVGITICEDLWNDGTVLPHRLYHRNPMEELAKAGATLVINAAASPFVVEKQALRERLMGSQAAAASIPIFFVNQVGGNDELLFDGASCALDAHGTVIARARAFEEDLLLVRFDEPRGARVEPYPDRVESVYRALVMGTRDYVAKCGFKEVVLGLSGGIDSAVTAAIATDALGKDRVHGIAMPSRYSSDHSVTDARALAANLGIDLRTIPIKTIHDSFERELTPFFEGRPPDITEENIQARTRGNILMALSNKFGWLLLTTGNKSELAVGYCTLYGDMCGGLAVISDVPKTLVYRIARLINDRAGREVIPAGTISKVPSAELRPDQHDQQTLPPYEVLDAILHAYIEEEKPADEIIAEGFDERVVRDVLRRVDRNEYKRKQAATGLKVTSRAFGIGRRMPIAARF